MLADPAGIENAGLALKHEKEFFDAERFGEVSVNVEINGLHQLFGVVFGRYDDYGDRRPHLFNLAGYFQSRHARQGYIGQHQIRDIFAEQIDSVFTAIGGVKPPAEGRQDLGDVRNKMRFSRGKKNR